MLTPLGYAAYAVGKWHLTLTGAGLTAGWATDFSPADYDYRGRFGFTGLLHRVEIDAWDAPVVDPAVEALDIISSQ